MLIPIRDTAWHSAELAPDNWIARTLATFKCSSSSESIYNSISAESFCSFYSSQETCSLGLLTPREISPHLVRKAPFTVRLEWLHFELSATFAVAISIWQKNSADLLPYWGEALQKVRTTKIGAEINLKMRWNSETFWLERVSPYSEVRNRLTDLEISIRYDHISTPYPFRNVP